MQIFQSIGWDLKTGFYKEQLNKEQKNHLLVARLFVQFSLEKLNTKTNHLMEDSGYGGNVGFLTYEHFLIIPRINNKSKFRLILN